MNLMANVKGRILIVDDEEHIREILAATLDGVSTQIFQANTAEAAMEVMREENIDVVISDIRMPGMDGLDFLHRMKTEQPSVRFLMITAHGTVDIAVKALRYGASDFLTKPFENREVRQIVERILREKLSASWPAVPPSTLAELKSLPGVVGESVQFKACLEKARKAAQSESTVLLTGESGSGKEVMARAIHSMGPRQDKAFIAVNCGAIPENLMESELFGHEKGAFTGAIASKPGKFVLANGGTLFLDEVGELPLPMQVKLLRVLQEKVVEPVGSTRPVKCDFRLVAATNRNLKEEVRAGRFREDLFYRLNIIPVELPPLRERREDVLPLARFFLKVFNERYGYHYVLTPENERHLQAYIWPGNVRELGNTMERAVVLGGPEGLAFQFEGIDLRSEAETRPAATGAPRIVSEAPGESKAVESDTTILNRANLRERKASLEREEILKALDKTRWNKTQAAELLNMSRRSLLYKIKEYGIQ